MTRTVMLLALCTLILSTALAAEAPVKFTKKPTARREGGKVNIDFAVNRNTDVAVYVLNAKGKIVRHLVAGVLGKNAPKPLKAGALAQSVAWDGKDDDGKPAAGGPFKIRVAAGMKVGWAGTAFSSQTGPNKISGVLGLATGPDGRVYVLSCPWGSQHWGPITQMHVFRRDGSYEKTIKPYPANLPLERIRATGAFRNAERKINPVIHRATSMSFYPYEDDTYQQMTVTRDGHVLLAVVPAAETFAGGTTAHLATIDAQGGLPFGSYAGPALLPASEKVRGWGAPRMAASSDGKAVYLTGLGTRKYRKWIKNLHAAYRIKLPARGPAEVFFGNPKASGNDKSHLKDPRGIAVDGKGHLLIADYGNNRVVVVSEKDRSFAGSFAVEAPEWVGVDHRSGAVYVCTKDSVVKLRGWKDPKQVARLKLPRRGTRHWNFRWSLALDASASPAVLWIGNYGARQPLLRCEDRRDRFTDIQPAGYYPSPRPWNLSADPTRQEVSCQVGGTYGAKLMVLSDESGKFRRVGVRQKEGQTFRLGPDKLVYSKTRFGGRGIRRYDRAGKEVPFPAKGKRPITNTGGSGFGFWERGFCIDRRGNIYVRGHGERRPANYVLDVYDSRGTYLRTAVWGLGRATQGPRVDAAGNIYLATSLRPRGSLYPEEFKKHLSGARQPTWYAWMYGSLVKFSPQGGAIPWPGYKGGAKLKPPHDTSMDILRYFNGTKGKLHGAEWLRFDYAPLNDGTGGDFCCCTPSEFDVDDFGRCFYPDQGRFRIMVRDTKGNQILHFGSYGNQDFCGPDSYVLDPAGKFLRPRRPGDPRDIKSPCAKPEIGFAWIIGVAVTDRHVYVADAINRRVLRCKIGYAAEETCAVR